MKQNEPNPNKKTFIQQIVTLDDLENFKQEIIAAIKNLLLEHTGQPTKKWLKTEDVRKLLNVSAGTLTTLRVNGSLAYTRVGGVLYYNIKDIEEMMQTNKFKH